MTEINEEDAVGNYMKVTLVNDIVAEGTLFTYNPEEGILVLLQNIQDPSLMMIRTPFIKEYTMEKNIEEKDRLPEQLDAFSALPSMHAGRNHSIFKHASVQLKEAEAERTRRLESLGPGASIAACDAFLKVARVYKDIAWDSEEQIIKVNQWVYVAGEPDWTKPVVKLVPDAPAKEKSMLERIRKTLESKKK